jgi:hypothetical protein
MQRWRAIRRNIPFELKIVPLIIFLLFIMAFHYKIQSMELQERIYILENGVKTFQNEILGQRKQNEELIRFDGPFGQYFSWGCPRMGNSLLIAMPFYSENEISKMESNLLKWETTFPPCGVNDILPLDFTFFYYGPKEEYIDSKLNQLVKRKSASLSCFRNIRLLYAGIRENLEHNIGATAQWRKLFDVTGTIPLILS